MIKRKLFYLVIFNTVLQGTITAQQITAEQLLQNVRAEFEKVKDYTATLDIIPNIENISAKETRITLYYKQPNKIHIESKNFVMIPKQLFETNPADLLSKFDATISDTATRNGVVVYTLRLISKPEADRPVHESFVWIDGSHWTITAIETVPMEGRKIRIEFNYTKVDGKYNLPSYIKASLSSSDQQEEKSTPRFHGAPGMPRNGTVEIRYSNYVVNSGLSDEIFENDKKKK
jgi:outer membrane lipoprotein-sorting protein